MTLRRDLIVCGSETLLAVLPGDTEDQRMIVALRGDHASEQCPGHLRLFDGDASSAPVPEACGCCGSESRPIVLRQETFSPAVGWFSQSCVEMSHAQWSAMRAMMPPETLAPTGGAAARSARRASRGFAVADAEPAILAMHDSQAVPA